MYSSQLAITSTTLEDLAVDRERHWRAGPGQENWLELQVQRGQAYRISHRGNHLGYTITTQDRALIEFDLEQQAMPSRSEIFRKAIWELDIKRGWCLSYDTVLLSLCSTWAKTFKSDGILFRKYQRSTLPSESCRFDGRLAADEDLPLLLRINEKEIFETDDELRAYVTARRIFVFWAGAKMIGFGLMTPIINGRPEVDIGMLVAPEFRGHGHGAAIIQFLAENVLSKGLTPVCGCHAKNIASQKSLERAGFMSEHRLIDFEVSS